MYQLHGTSALWGPKNSPEKDSCQKSSFWDSPFTIGGVALGAMLTLSSFGAYVSLKKHPNSPVALESRLALPKVDKNQALIAHPDYLSGYIALGYTLLTDIDHDGHWDLADQFHAGFTPGDGSHTLFYKKGYGPAQSVDAKVKTVGPEFFEPYEYREK